jgi:hypothetical protein
MASRDQQGESITPTTSQLAVPVDVTADAAFREANAVIDSQLVNAHWRWLHARWGKTPKDWTRPRSRLTRFWSSALRSCERDEIPQLTQLHDHRCYGGKRPCLSRRSRPVVADPRSSRR